MDGATVPYADEPTHRHGKAVHQTCQSDHCALTEVQYPQRKTRTSCRPSSKKKKRTSGSRDEKVNLELLGIREATWSGSGQKRLATGEMMLFSGPRGDDAPHSLHVSLLICGDLWSCIMAW